MDIKGHTDQAINKIAVKNKKNLIAAMNEKIILSNIIEYR